MPTSRVSTGRGVKRIDLAYVELASSELARDINRDVVLELIRTHQPVDRAELARLSRLQPSTISSIAEQLMRERWITEGAVAKRPRGRRPTMLTLNEELVILVADLRPAMAILAVIDLNGRFLSRESVPLPTSAETATHKIAEAMIAMRRQFPAKIFEGVGVSVPGRVNPDTQRILMAPNLHWSDFDVRTTLSQRLKLQVELDNDANACLISELWFGRMNGIRNAVLVAVGEGVGCAILSGGQMLGGRDGLAGEFGHIPIDPAGPLCGCGQRGCWEMFASNSAALRYYAESQPKIPTPSLRIEDLLMLAAEGNSRALAAFDKQAHAIGRGLRLITAALSPELIIVIGDITALWRRLAPIVEKELAASMLAGSPPKLTAANDGELARLRGAAALVLQRHSGYHRSTHIPRRRTIS